MPWVNAIYWLAPSAYSVFASYITQDNLARDGLIHSGLNFPTSIINEENALQACLQASLREVASQVSSSWLPASQMTLAWSS